MTDNISGFPNFFTLRQPTNRKHCQYANNNNKGVTEYCFNVVFMCISTHIIDVIRHYRTYSSSKYKFSTGKKYFTVCNDGCR